MRQWVPIVRRSDPLSMRSWDAINSIAEAISRQDYDSRRSAPHEEALLFAYLAIAVDNQEWADLAIARLNDAIEAATPMTFGGLFGGLAGIGWTIDHLSKLLAGHFAPDDEGPIEPRRQEPENEDLSQDIETLLLRQLQCGTWRGPYDLISGLVGFGVYFQPRLPSPNALLGVELLLYHLERTAQRFGEQVSWHTPPELVPGWQAERYPDGYYDLGVAHGIPAVLDFLSKLISASVEPKKAGRLLEGGMKWLIAQERPPGGYSRFGALVSAHEPGESRLAWCYGDLGIAALLLEIARRSGREDWSCFASKIAESCLARDLQTVGATDVSLCHGYIGIAHIFNRMYQRDGDPRFAASALKYFDKALTMRRDEGGVAGFVVTRTPAPDLPPVSEPGPAFLDGAIGVALGLLAAVTPVEPAWDKMLLLSGEVSNP